MKEKSKFFSIFLLFIPLLILLLNPFLQENIVSSIWYYIILYLGFSCILYLCYLFLKKYPIKYKKEYFPILILFLFMIWVGITTLLSDDLLTSLGGNLYRREGFLTYISYAGFYLTAILVPDKDKMKFYKFFVIVGLILSILTICKNPISNLFVGTSDEYKSIFHQFNHFGYFLLMTIICDINLFLFEEKKEKKVFYFISFIILMQMLMKNNTFGSYIAVLEAIMMMSIYFLFINPKRKQIIFLLLSFFLLSIDYSNPSNNAYSEFSRNILSLTNINYKNINDSKEQKKIDALGTNRGELWKGAICLIKEKPITGYGLDNIKNRYEKIGIMNADRPHNIILQMSVFVGIPGMILYVTAIASIVIGLLINIKKLKYEILISFFVVIGYFVSSLTANSMYYTTPYFMVFLGYATSGLLKIKK